MFSCEFAESGCAYVCSLTVNDMFVYVCGLCFTRFSMCSVPILKTHVARLALAVQDSGNTPWERWRTLVSCCDVDISSAIHAVIDLRAHLRLAVLLRPYLKKADLCCWWVAV